MILPAKRDTTGRNLLVLFGILFAALAVNPHHRADWLLENVLVLAILPWLIWIHLRSPLSRSSIWFIFLFAALHEVGSHYTYSEVPYEQWWASITGHSVDEWPGPERNYFDRLVHFLFGALLFQPIREGFTRATSLGGFWAGLFSVLALIAASTVYELIEWFAASVFGGELGMAYLGTQGDIWDAHKDIGMAMIGALIAAAIAAALARRTASERSAQTTYANQFRATRSGD